jgi:hypothetical protein
MKGPEGYGRYNDDPDFVGCPRAKSDMTPCVARDGSMAVVDTGECVGCGRRPGGLLDELLQATGEQHPGGQDADALRDLVLVVTEPS